MLDKSGYPFKAIKAENPIFSKTSLGLILHQSKFSSISLPKVEEKSDIWGVPSFF